MSSARFATSYVGDGDDVPRIRKMSEYAKSAAITRIGVTIPRTSTVIVAGRSRPSASRLNHDATSSPTITASPNVETPSMIHHSVAGEPACGLSGCSEFWPLPQPARTNATPPSTTSPAPRNLSPDGFTFVQRATRAKPGKTIRAPMAQLALTLAAAVAYAAAAVRVRRRRGTLDRLRAASFALGIALLLVAFLSPLDRLGEERYFSAHMAQHL